MILTRQEVRDCDRIAIEQFGISGLVLMENAGSAAARLILSLLKEPSSSRLCVLAGVGNNAGDGFVVARHLFNASVAVDVVICGRPDRFRGDALSNLRIIEKMALPVTYIDQSSTNAANETIRRCAESADIIVDAMLGTGASGPPREPMRSAIQIINDLDKTVVALDIPSGLDCDTGEPLETAIRADHTVTFAAMKKGFQRPAAAQYTGKITVASIGINTTFLQAD